MADIELVIKIPEEQYKTLNARSQDDVVAVIDYALLIKAIENGKPLDNVLDEIKAEFKSKADGDDWYHTTDGLVWEEAIEIIDKYRKGESE